MIVSDLTRKVNEYRVFGADGKTLIAQATIKNYREVPLSNGIAGMAEPSRRRARFPRISSSTGSGSSSPSTWC